MKRNKISFLGVLIFICSPAFSQTDLTSPEKTAIQTLSFIQSQKWEELYHCFTLETTQKIEKLTKDYLSLILFFSKKKIENKEGLYQELQSLTGKPYFIRLMKYGYWNEPRAYHFKEMNFGGAVFYESEVFMEVELVDQKDKKRKEKIYFKKEGNSYLVDLTPQLKKYSKK